MCRLLVVHACYLLGLLTTMCTNCHVGSLQCDLCVVESPHSESPQSPQTYLGKQNDDDRATTVVASPDQLSHHDPTEIDSPKPGPSTPPPHQPCPSSYPDSDPSFCVLYAKAQAEKAQGGSRGESALDIKARALWSYFNWV